MTLLDAAPPRRHVVVVSDVHLSQAHPEDPADPMWMRYRRREHHPDRDYAALVDHLLDAHPGDAFELVFNGDVLDYDAPWVKGGTSSFDEFSLDEAGCVEQTRRILADHDEWFRAVARALLRGHRALFLSGNHDIELYWPGVRGAIREELGRLCDEERARVGGEPPDLERAVCFRAWFHVTEDRVYLEHGSQYDFLNGVRHAMLPVTKAEDRIHPVLGKLAFKRTGSRMGYFNPYYEETFYLGFSGYLTHFLEHYARSHRHIVRTWAKGSLATALEIWRHRHTDDRHARGRLLAQAETGASLEAIDATYALSARPAEDTMIPILRELWLDRTILAGGLLSAAILGALAGGASTGGVVLAAFGALFGAYELLTPKPDIRTYDSAPPEVLRLFDIHGVRAICMGHTHRPFGRWDAGRFHGNSGAWCPAFRDALCTEPVLPARPLLWLTSAEGELRGGLFWWRAGRLEADAGPAG
jgi:UDP-2,3-diacylglucosamine pyrophosphatase LpxH